MPWPLLWLWFKVWVFFFSSNRENKGSKNITTLPYWLVFTTHYSLFRASGPNRPFSFSFFFFSFYFWEKIVLLFPSFFLNMCCHLPMTREWLIDGRKTINECIIFRRFWDTVMFISDFSNTHWVEKVWFQTYLKSCTPTTREVILDPFNLTNQVNCIYCKWREICHLLIGS